MNPTLQRIADAPRDYANGSLELASMVLEAWAAGLDIEELRPAVESWVDSIKTKPGIYRRSPNNHEQSSHDETLGIAVLSKLYSLDAAADTLDQGLTFGLWFSGKAHSSWLWGKLPFDGEWFVFWRPEYRAYMKLGAGRQLSGLEKWCLETNLTMSTTWNLKRIRLLFLSYLGYKNLTPYIAGLGDKYKGRYGNNSIYLNLWSLNKGKYKPNGNVEKN